MDIEVSHRPVSVRARRLRRAQLFMDGPVILLALLFLISGLGNLVAGPVPGSVEIPEPYYTLVACGFVVGATVKLVGALSRRVAFEIAGNLVLVAPMIINLLLAAHLVGLHRTTILLSVFVVGFSLRAYGLYAGWREVNDG